MSGIWLRYSACRHPPRAQRSFAGRKGRRSETQSRGERSSRELPLALALLSTDLSPGGT